MSTRVYSPPSSIMDVPRDLQGCPSHGSPTSGSLPVASSTQSASSPPPTIFGSSTSSSGQQVTVTVTTKKTERCLFGPPDSKSCQLIHDQVKKIRELDMERWNFDFENEIPLQGRYQWTPICQPTSTISGSSSAPAIMNPSSMKSTCINSQFATETSGGNAGLNDRQPLLTAFPPTPVKIYPEDRSPLPNRNLPVISKSSASSSSFSSQSSPEASTNVIENINCIPSPPSSVEEGSSSPADDDLTGEQRLISTRIRSTTSPKSSSQPPITQYMSPRKRPAPTRTTSPSAEKKTAL